MTTRTRAFSRRFQKQRAQRCADANTTCKPCVYSAGAAFLRPVDKSAELPDGKGGGRGDERLPTDDPLFGRGLEIREDGRKLHPMYLLQVKSRRSRRANWDFYKG